MSRLRGRAGLGVSRGRQWPSGGGNGGAGLERSHEAASGSAKPTPEAER